jgi:hypothetical protein
MGTFALPRPLSRSVGILGLRLVSLRAGHFVFETRDLSDTSSNRQFPPQKTKQMQTLQHKQKTIFFVLTTYCIQFDATTFFFFPLSTPCICVCLWICV